MDLYFWVSYFYSICFLIYSLCFRVLCCLGHCFYRNCCTTTITEQDRGYYIERTTIVDVGAKKADEVQQKMDDECLAECGNQSMFCAFKIIPWGYEKIFECYAK